MGSDFAPVHVIAGRLSMGCTPAYWPGGTVTPDYSMIVNLYPCRDYRWHGGQIMVKYALLDAQAAPPRPERLLTLANLVVDHLSEGGHVLVHCEQGLNRSGLVVALALIKGGVSARMAVHEVQQKRPGALFNRQFVEWLHTQG